MTRFLTHLFVVGLGVAAAAWLVPGVRIDSIPALVFAALVLAFANAILRPLLVLLTLPVTILTLGLFYLVVSGLVFGLAAAFVPGFTVDGLLSAVLGAIVVGLTSWFAGMFIHTEPPKNRRPER